ncbi:amino acid adenylation domain-containing protein [Mycobacterium intracellulare subsp. chimaera]|uniref:Non-ribosomal peptide synthetase n=1 Tax=Mycobacterium intracellulare subsp. chimaera TaxID=222805 RepID=A0A7U5MIW1_MYCIT|nr:non-ribosomal peptide synthetase [Mycobacterium intracellulare]ASL14400.1 non-ribosomal peptide synthetase MbtF [Mycobacterium intracellulare subsp. chimaera]ETZ32915.1 amino acid adenylation domain protein [Mycobacterium intracellulare MIN_052511_1280]MCF1815214.1 amino acid adenylation domain-containing protein [Mycobacterium intracellulare subsp. intracellulare]MDM3909326.1 non-ribosomal peptide synthetase [Mycobacterium intracellulare subsp. chimaera]MDM3930015.1 non-ribosomal peptide s
MNAQIEDVLALSPLQEGLFALHRLADDDVDLYSMQFIVDIDGPIDVPLLRRSAQALLDRHPNLRVAFWDRDVPRPVQVVPTYAELPWSERIAAPDEFEAIARSQRRLPFDLSRGPALRVVLLTVPGQTRRRMILTVHHILVDGWALAVFFTEMLAVYSAGGSLDGLPPAPLYRDYIVWLAKQDNATAIAKWVEYLRGASGPLMLAEPSAAAGAGVPQTAQLLLSAADTARLRQWAATNGFTLNTAVLFAWSVLLGRLADRQDVVFGTVVSGRPEQLPGVESMVGLFINTVPVIHQISGSASVLEQCVQLQRQSSMMRDIGYLSLSQLQREHGHGPMFDTLFVFENAPIGDAIRTVTAPDGASFDPIEMESLTHYPLTVVSHLIDDALVVLVEMICEALPHLSPADICERLAGLLRQLPHIGDAGPAALDVSTAAERAESAAMPVVPVPEGTVWEVFQRQAEAMPDAVALTTSSDERYTYAELHAQACGLASVLAGYDVRPEAVVALALPRSARSVIAILAVFAAGGAYLPIDVTMPATRIESMLHQANPTVIITEHGYTPPAGQWRILVIDDPVKSAAPLADVARHADQAAYVIFTSGSTGEPKGVIGTNAALLSYFVDHRNRVYRDAAARLGRPLRIAHAWSFGFDASWQPMVGLLDGHSLHLFNAEEMRDTDQLVNGIIAHGVDMIDTTPTMFVQLEAAGLADHPLPVLALGGEAIDGALWERLGALSSTAVYNCYGPTEATVEAVVAPVRQYRAPTIGTPNAGTAGYVLDSALRKVPTGVVGELYLSGAQLTRGYLGRAGMTAERFVADPFRPGQRMYRTGDLVRQLSHGGYAYVGRGDTQVKIRGYRIEIGEIEAAMRGRPEVLDAAVCVVPRAGGVSLVGAVVWRTDGDPARVRAALAEQLPAYMVPARIVSLSRLPVNANGKLDGPVLERVALEALDVGNGTAQAWTDTERSLCEIFAEQFNGTIPDIDGDFFEIGMDSIVAIALVHKARARGLTVSPRMVFAASTIRRLAAAIDSTAEAGPIENVGYGKVLPLPMVSWLFEHGNYRRFSNSVLIRLPDDIERSSIELMLQLLLDGHEALRSILVDTADGPRLVTREPGVVAAADVVREVDGPISVAARQIIDETDPAAGAMVRAAWLRGTDGRPVLLLSVHHLVVDVVSWQIILTDLAEAWRSLTAGATPMALPEFTSYRHWSQLMWQRAVTPEVSAQRDYWIAQVRDPDPPLGERHPDPTRDTWSTLHKAPVLTPVEVTAQILATLSRAEGLREFLLAATAMTVASWRRERAQDPSGGTLIALDGHGRADAVLEADTTGTVGWFTTAFPVRLGAGTHAVDIEAAQADPGRARALLDSVASYLATIPYDGLDYGLLRYVNRIPELAQASEPQIMFSYMGRLDISGVTEQPWSLLSEFESEGLPIDPEPDLPLRFALYTSAWIRSTTDGPQLMTTWLWSDALFTAADIDRLIDLWQCSIAVLAGARQMDSA